MLEEKVKKAIEKYNLIQNGDKIVIGVSGGPDSICLLHILNILKKELNFEIFVAHINHMIRKEADEETKYVQMFCEKLGIQCFVRKIDVQDIAVKEGKGTEETGRNVRYCFFEEVLKKTNANKIATAHNNNDKVETILMNIIRGSGTSGLKGIEAKRQDKFIRPLIDIEREEIEKYCIENNLQPRYDKSNDENIYTRNKIRNIVIPYIKKEFNPNIIKTINRLSDIVAEETQYLEEMTKQEFQRIFICTDMESSKQKIIALDLKKFNNLDLVIKRRLILYTINKTLGYTNGIEKINIEEIINLCSNNIGNKYLIPIKEIKVLVKNKNIFFIRNIEVP